MMNQQQIVRILIFGYILKDMFSIKSIVNDEIVKIKLVNFIGQIVLMIVGISSNKASYEDIESLLMCFCVWDFIGQHTNKQELLKYMCSSYLTLDQFSIFTRIIISISFYKMSELSFSKTLRFVTFCLVFFFFRLIINFINEKKKYTKGNWITSQSLNKTEIYVLSTMATALMCTDFVSENKKTLLMFKILIVSLIPVVFIGSVLVNKFSEINFLFLMLGKYIITCEIYFRYLKEDGFTKQLFHYVGDKRVQKILMFWVFMCLTVIPTTLVFEKNMNLNWKRKIWHFVLVLALIFDMAMIKITEFVILSLECVTTVMIIAEILRYKQVTFVGKMIFKKFSAFQDKKDSIGPLNLSNVFLLIGFTVPIIYDYYLNNCKKISIISFFGLVFIGISDSCASIMGINYGQKRWFKSQKTLIGTFFFFILSIVCFYLIDMFLRKNHHGYYNRVTDWYKLTKTSLLASLIESNFVFNDNLIIPLICLKIYQSLS